MSGYPASYGELVELGVHLTAAACRDAANVPLAPGCGPTMIASYWDAIECLARHARQVTATDRDIIVDGRAREIAWDEPVTRLLAALPAPAPVQFTARRSVAAGALWAGAVRSWRAGADLLATHHDQWGHARGPDAHHLDDPEAQAAALGPIAASLRDLLAAREQVRLRACQAGMRWPDALALVPDQPWHGPLRTAATVLAARYGTRAGSWREQTVARPAVWVEDGWSELTGRIRRLRVAVWELSRGRDINVRALGDAALGAITVQQLAATLSGSNPVLRERGTRGVRDWSLVRVELQHWRSALPPLRRTRVDLRALLSVTGRLAGIEGPPPGRHLDAALDAVADIATHSAGVIRRAADDGALFVRGRHLRGEDITDDVTLVAAKLGDRLAPVPRTQVERVAAVYELAAANRSPIGSSLHRSSPARAGTLVQVTGAER